jgi:hypothetical protein
MRFNVPELSTTLLLLANLDATSATPTECRNPIVRKEWHEARMKLIIIMAKRLPSAFF